jgi:hypothetical protein
MRRVAAYFKHLRPRSLRLRREGALALAAASSPAYTEGMARKFLPAGARLHHQSAEPVCALRYQPGGWGQHHRDAFAMHPWHGGGPQGRAGD